MFYQTIDMSEELFSVKICSLGAYPLHWHSDLEILFCLQGSLNIRIDEVTYRVTEGETLMIGSSQPHTYLGAEEDNKVILLRVGSLFLRETLFGEVARKQFEKAILGETEEVSAVFKRIAELTNGEISTEEKLEKQGCIYFLLSLLLKNLPQVSHPFKNHNKRLNYILNVQEALDYVSKNFQNKITIETVAKVAGYEKNAFCRVFKQATDTSFHQYLNSYRIKKACVYLLESGDSVSAIAWKVGFEEPKTFWRVFKQIVGVTPNEYRQQETQNN
ncbi:MAG: helix-turn-helix domain-containing protein [Ruminococcaceae bacterium]|nr:helix-turn-helix domain-containing protein [Oscillospiraceae bacterium]